MEKVKQMITTKTVKYITMLYVGFTSYITVEVLFRGYSFWLMGIVGAICFFIIQGLNNYISWEMDILLQGIIGSIVITCFELIVGEFDKHILHMNMWDYSMMWKNFDGVICPLFSLLWVFISIFAVILGDAIDYYLLGEKQRPYYKLFGKVMFIMPMRPSK